MIFFVISFYVLISIYEIKALYYKNSKREIWVYIILMSISFIISLLVALNIDIPDPMKLFGKFIKFM